MGSFFGSTYTRGVDRDTVRSVLENVARTRRCSFLLAPEIRGWIQIFPSEDQDNKPAAEIHRRLKADVLHVIVHDSDLFCYWYYRGGELVDEYNSRPDYFGKVSQAERLSQRGKPEELRGLLHDPATVNQLRALLSSKDPADPFYAHTLLNRFAALLGLPNCAASYNCLTGDPDDDEIERRGEFLHVPDLAPEQAKRASAHSAMQAELERLRNDGLLLFEKSPAPFPPFADPAGAGFLALDLTAPPGPQPLLRLREPWSGSPTPTGLSLRAHSLCISRSGHLLASGSAGGIEVWDLRTNQRLCQIPGTAQSRTSVVHSFTPDETTLITSGDEIGLRSIADGQLIRSIPVQPYGRCALHPSGSFLILREDRIRLSVIDLSTGAVVRTFSLEDAEDFGLLQRAQVALVKQFMKHSRKQMASGLPPDVVPDVTWNDPITAEEVASLDFSQDGRFLFCGTNRAAWVFNWEALLASSEEHPRPVYRCRFGQKTTGFSDLLLKHLDPIAAVFDVAHDPAANSLLLACGDGNIRQIHLASGRQSILLAVPGAKPLSNICLSSDGTLLCTIERPSVRNLRMKLGDPFALPVEDDRPDRLLIWDYRKLRDASRV